MHTHHSPLYHHFCWLNPTISQMSGMRLSHWSWHLLKVPPPCSSLGRWNHSLPKFEKCHLSLSKNGGSTPKLQFRIKFNREYEDNRDKNNASCGSLFAHIVSLTSCDLNSHLGNPKSVDCGGNFPKFHPYSLGFVPKLGIPNVHLKHVISLFSA